MQSFLLRSRGFKFLGFSTPLSNRLISMSADPQPKRMPSALTLHHHAKCSVCHAMPNSNAPLLQFGTTTDPIRLLFIFDRPPKHAHPLSISLMARYPYQSSCRSRRKPLSRASHMTNYEIPAVCFVWITPTTSASNLARRFSIPSVERINCKAGTAISWQIVEGEITAILIQWQYNQQTDNPCDT